MKINIRLCIIILILPIIFFSCIGISSEIWFSEDGSGKIQLEYRIPDLLIEKSMNDSGNVHDIIMENGIAIPEFLSKDNIHTQLSHLETFTLTDYKVWKKYTDSYIYCEISFSDSSEFYSLALIPEVEIQHNNDGTVEFEQAINYDSSLDQEDRKVVQVYRDYVNTFIIHAPKKISSYNTGILSEDGKTVVFTRKLLSVNDNNQPEKTDLQDTLIVEW